MWERGLRQQQSHATGRSWHLRNTAKRSTYRETTVRHGARRIQETARGSALASINPASVSLPWPRMILPVSRHRQQPQPRQRPPQRLRRQRRNQRRRRPLCRHRHRRARWQRRLHRHRSRRLPRRRPLLRARQPHRRQLLPPQRRRRLSMRPHRMSLHR